MRGRPPSAYGISPQRGEKIEACGGSPRRGETGVCGSSPRRGETGVCGSSPRRGEGWGAALPEGGERSRAACGWWCGGVPPSAYGISPQRGEKIEACGGSPRRRENWDLRRLSWRGERWRLCAGCEGGGCFGSAFCADVEPGVVGAEVVACAETCLAGFFEQRLEAADEVVAARQRAGDQARRIGQIVEHRRRAGRQ